MVDRKGKGESNSYLERQSDRAVYVISVAAELSGMHPQTLRIYERKGLLDPARTDGGSRRYSQDDIERLRRIQELTNSGIGLEGVKRIMALETEIKELKEKLRVLEERSKAEQEKIHKHYRRDLVPLSQAVVLFRGAKRP
ncbi:MerR family transcriptional regulator, heat shock protein HspR [Ferrithrix thermotolerans DSM 19514]|jgi:MerR family transcriptional regulator/heat shock protein HspR|uniref:MerR family transcriptional regulator, heat shock protein HspR n=1 Tax=Ferrithrix thermotolerans DSM 19514 TaxID=1121881 RepID=A0A1M4TWZ7_9ACTN|nr:helix-turn-helix transcriptional regulator [Ferrithrix thermotolerans]SHE48943.1 MerR family transcriptional regulator, heat shock protein HspR [Ferrithrix thermotolerans DSM 19514]